MRATDISYVLPLRWSSDDGFEELASYLRRIRPEVTELVVVDGSPPPLFGRHAEALEGLARHIPPDAAYDFEMGKVNGVTTGVLAARCERVVIADDDVRYGPDELRRTAALLEEAHLVRPQNYFDPLPWHTRLDTGRTLLNRVYTGDLEFPSGDFPGTLAIRRSAFVATGGYDGDVMFENLELMRTVTAAGGTVVTPLDLLVRRIPPSTAHFRSQRVRQAYDDFAVPLRMAAFLAVAPAVAVALLARRPRVVVAGLAAIASVAEWGRRRGGGSRHFPASSSLLAPVWVLERAASAWGAVWSRWRHGGICYGDGYVGAAANSPAELRRRLSGGVGLRRVALRLEPDQLVGPVAERQDAGATAAAERERAPT